MVQSSEQMISVSLQWNGHQVLVSLIHASCFRAERRNLWVELGTAAAQSLPWVVLGDFNAMLNSHEKRGRGRFNVGVAVEFQAMAAIPKPQNATFRIHRFWMEAESFDGLVREVWSWEVRGGPIGRLAHKLRAVKSALKGWARQRFPNLDVELKVATEEVEEVQRIIDQVGMFDELYSREVEAKTRLLKVVEMHEKLWVEKARYNWAKLGDRNSKFFHLSVKVCRIKNIIRSLKKQDGTVVSEPLQMVEYVSHFFENFHKVDHCIDHMELLQVIPNEVNMEDSSILEAIPDREEIRKVVEGAVSLDKFFPICTANFFCKVLSKIMAERLSCFLPRLVSDEQGAFQKGKIISKNIVLASELANLLHTSIRGGGMGIKIDVQKAYDTLSWDFLFAVLKRFSFSDVWLAWIHEILVSSRILVLLNGGPVGFFRVEKGLRQGDPISPMLFILAKEVLCRGLNGLLKEGKLKVLPGPRCSTIPSHLLFVDDIFIFMNVAAKHVRCLREFLLKYQEFSGKNSA
ncbi:uncharacterized protein LOC122074231 [Macadamia integrifolia]|uniref:uncharacterized protein LOC122074231 n=1 Tax=Macadamia integrifolia TaxID=60698 RepID=UPI001C4E8A71|nr:uncharacterized protein LOC122074231 [Macadamia integrifolia]